ncbi:MAG: NAD-dependent epimerase/dehydratase family protein [Candidatus Nanoarchaeia archaeon]
MKALVTGGAGLIGSHITDLLLRKGFEVRIIDNLQKEKHPYGKPDWIPEEVEFIQADIADKEEVKKALDGVDVVFHEAAYGGFAPDTARYFSTNTIGTLNLFLAIREGNLPIKKVVVASSQGVYGEGTYTCLQHGKQEPVGRKIEDLSKGYWGMRCEHCGEAMQALPTSERRSPNPRSIYSLTKYDTEVMSLRFGRDLNIPVVALRYSITYGPRQSIFNPYTGVCSIFSIRLLNNLPPVIYEDGKQLRDFVFVEDVAEANWFVYQNKNIKDQVYNVGTGKPTNVLDFVHTLAEVYNKKNVEPALPGEFRPGDMRDLYSDNTKLAKEGFTPRVSLKDGIQKYVEWIQTRENLVDYFEKARVLLKERGIIQTVQK